MFLVVHQLRAIILERACWEAVLALKKNTTGCFWDSQDATFEMERKRNRPEKYNRLLVQKSVKAMKKILDIRKARQDRFYENRCVNPSCAQVREGIALAWFQWATAAADDGSAGFEPVCFIVFFGLHLGAQNPKTRIACASVFQTWQGFDLTRVE